MMTDVACFCGCLYSFDGGGAACPKCGEYATVTVGPLFNGTGRSRQEQPVPAMNGARACQRTDRRRADLARAPILPRRDPSMSSAIEEPAGTAGKRRPPSIAVEPAEEERA